MLPNKSNKKRFASFIVYPVSVLDMGGAKGTGYQPFWVFKLDFNRRGQALCRSNKEACLAWWWRIMIREQCSKLRCLGILTSFREGNVLVIFIASRLWWFPFRSGAPAWGCCLHATHLRQSMHLFEHKGLYKGHSGTLHSALLILDFNTQNRYVLAVWLSTPIARCFMLCAYPHFWSFCAYACSCHDPALSATDQSLAPRFEGQMDCSGAMMDSFIWHQCRQRGCSGKILLLERIRKDS